MFDEILTQKARDWFDLNIAGHKKEENMLQFDLMNLAYSDLSAVDKVCIAFLLGFHLRGNRDER